MPPPVTVQDPTPFELFVAKLDLDDKTQQQDTAKIFTSSAAEAATIGKDVTQLRARIVEVGLASGDMAPVTASYTAASTRLTGLEVRTFQQVFALLQKKQQSKASEAFVLMAGLLDPALPGSQGGRRGRGGFGGGGATRLEVLTTVLKLEGDQKKQVKSIMDAEYKAAATVRDTWTKSRVAVGTAIQTGAASSDIEQAIARHAADAATMASAEMQALVKILAVLTPEQKNNTAIQTAIFAMRRAFTGKKWDVTPD
jgi:Spy/CpxP family protein refolding chaperone